LTGTPTSMLQQLASRFHFQVVALTRGAQGAILVRGEEVSEEPGVQTTVVDTVGAGDAFTATLAIGLLQGRDLQWINRKACEVAAFVCSMSGATPKLPERLYSETAQTS
jgi:fructokinase